MERGYDNRAVVGGLDKIIPAWEQDALNEGVESRLVHAICQQLSSYPQQSMEERQNTVQSMLDLTKNPELPSEKPTPTFSERGPSPPDAEHPAASASANAHPISTQPRPVRATPSQPGSQTPAGLSASLDVLPGIGPKNAQNLHKLGLNKLEDLLYYLPRRYDDFSKMKRINMLQYGEELSVAGTVQKAYQREVKGNRSILEAIVSDGTGSLRVTWFNQPWLEKSIRPGVQLILSGKVDLYLGRLCMNNPEWELLEQEHLHTNRIVPVYSLTAGVSQKLLRRMMHQTVNFWAPRLSDYLPENIRAAGNLPPLQKALLQVHFPDNDATLESARQRLAFDEIFLIQLGVLRQKRAWQSTTARRFDTPEEWIGEQIARLPYALTGAQQRVINEIRADLASGRPMNRLLQGDV